MLFTAIRSVRAYSFLFLIPSALAQSPALVDVTSAGHAPTSGAKDAGISADGRWVAFVSDSTDLVAEDTNAAGDVFLRDRESGAIARVSVATGGAQSHPVPTVLGNLSVASPCVSGDGRFVAFASNAPDLVANDTNSAFDVFVRDVVSGTTERVSIAANGAQATGDSGALDYQHFAGTSFSYQRPTGVCITPDGRYVAFASMATGLVSGIGAIPQQSIYVHDRATGTTELVSANPVGGAANSACWFPSISDDGRFVAFDSSASDLVDGDANGVNDVFVRDRTTSVTFRASLATQGQEANGASGFLFEQYHNACACTLVVPLGSQISADGRKVVFGSQATNLTTGNVLPASSNVFVRDLVTNVTTLVSAGPGGAGGDGSSLDPAISADGRFVAYVSSAHDIVDVGAHGGDHILVRDQLLGTTRLASADASGGGVDEIARQPSLSADGNQIAFTTSAHLEDGDQNQADDVYASGAAGGPFIEACAGSAGTCPCSNAGSPGAGCANSTWAEGARLVASGTPSVAHDSLVLIATRLIADTGVLFVQSGTSFHTGTAPAFGDGVRCVGGTILRLATRQASEDTAILGVGDDARLSVLGHVPAAGGSRFYQACYRNLATFCTNATLNSTNSIRVDWLP